MLNVILAIYTVVALIGIYMFVSILLKRKPGLILGIIHGVLGLAGIALLIIVSSYSGSHGIPEIILLFFLAFMVGGGIFAAKIFINKSSIWVYVIHALIAAAGMYLLFLYSCSTG